MELLFYASIANTTLVTRYAIEGGLNEETAFSLSDVYIRKMEQCTDVDALMKLNEQMAYLSEVYHGHFISLNTLNIDISSKMLRSWHQEGRSLRYYVPDAVAEYIDKNHIYQTTEGDVQSNV